MRHIHRHLQSRIQTALSANPIVFLNGPRQAGKSTLVKHLAKKEFPAEYVSFDQISQMEAAAHAPESYLRTRQGAVIIDEVQMVPDIFRALKVIVDERREKRGTALRGQFLLTGSANIMALPKMAAPLVGRMGVLTLYPLASAEIYNGKGDFIDRVFQGNFRIDQKKRSKNIVDQILASTFPQAARLSAPERLSWFDGYLTTILQRDVRALAEIEKMTALPNLLRIMANRVGGLINDSDIARSAGLNITTTRNYKTLLKMLFLTFDVPPWYRNVGKRLVKSPKSYLIDTLLLCHILQYDPAHLAQNQPHLFGHVLENFVATELLKLTTFMDHPGALYHFRTSDQKEVDFVIEKKNGDLIGIEVKKRDTVTRADFNGLNELKRLSKANFKNGIVLYMGTDVIPFGDDLWAVPLSYLAQ